MPAFYVVVGCTDRGGVLGTGINVLDDAHSVVPMPALSDLEGEIGRER